MASTSRLAVVRFHGHYAETYEKPNLSDRIVGITGYAVRPPEARREKPKVSAFTWEDRQDPRPEAGLGADVFRSAGRHRRRFDPPRHRGPCLQPAQRRWHPGGAIADATDRAEHLLDQLRARLDSRRRSARLDRQPRVFFEEWDEPLISGIGWVSELIGIAGGDYIFAELAEAGRRRSGSRPQSRWSAAGRTSSPARGAASGSSQQGSASDPVSPAFRLLEGASFTRSNRPSSCSRGRQC